MEETNKFNQWLEKELSRRGWSEFRLAKEGGAPARERVPDRQGGASGVEGGGGDCGGAGAAGGSLVFRKAGLLGSENGGEIDLEEWKAVLERLEEKEHSVRSCRGSPM